MKTLVITFISLFTALFANAQQKGVQTITISVKGNCDMCKTRIENAADIKGVKLCIWDEEKQSVTVTYKPEKVTPEQIEKAIALSGHDAGNTKADIAKYKQLPSCCQYRDQKCEDKK